MDEQSIRSEMHKIARAGIEAGEVTSLDQIVHGVLSKRTKIEGEDAIFYRVHALDDLKRIAKSVVGKYATGDSTAEDLLLPGFRHLCRAYPMTRDDVVSIVPVDLCTDDELKARAAQLDEMAKGCRDHAREIREYVLARVRSVA